MDSTIALNKTSLTKASHYFLTMSGLFVNTQTVTIAGVVFTFVTALSSGPAVPGEIKIGTAAANLIHLAAVLQNPSLATNANYTAISAGDAAILTALNLVVAAPSATVLTVENPYMNSITVAETQTNGAWTQYSYSKPLPLSTKSNTSLQFLGESVTSGNGVFTVEVSNNNNDWVVYNRLTSNVTNTNAQTDTRVASATVSSNSSQVFSVPVGDSFGYMRVKCVPTTDGLYSAFIYNR